MTLTSGTRRLFLLLAIAIAGIVAYDVGTLRRGDDRRAPDPTLPGMLDLADNLRRGLDDTPLLYPAEFIRDLVERRRDVLVAAQPALGASSAGFVVGPRGEMLVAHSSTEPEWRVTAGGRVLSATLMAYDAVHGVALLRAPELALTGGVEMAPAAGIEAATPLLGLHATPAGVAVRTLTAPGTVPALVDRLREAGLTPGEVVLDLQGRVVAFKGSVAPVPLLPVDLQEIAAALSTTGRHAHPWIGADVQTVDAELAPLVGDGRIVVVHVEPGSPAAEAGLAQGMLFARVETDRGSATTADRVGSLLRQSEQVRFVPVDEDATAIHVEVGDRQVPPEFAASSSGVATAAPGQPLSVLPGSPAARSGLTSGDVVEAISDDRTISTDDIDALVASMEPQLVTVRRGWRRFFLVVPSPALTGSAAADAGAIASTPDSPGPPPAETSPR